MYVEKRVSFDPERDREIIDFLDKMTSHKSNQLIRELLRSYIKNSRESQLDRMESKLNLLITLSTEPMSYSSVKTGNFDDSGVIVPEEIVINIDNLGV